MLAYDNPLRRLRRRIPFPGYWWVPVLWQVSIILFTSLSLVVWLSPGGESSLSGVLLRWLWAITALVRVLLSLVAASAAKIAKQSAGRSTPRLPWPIRIACDIIAIVGFATARLDVAVGALYLLGASARVLAPDAPFTRLSALKAGLCALTVGSFLARIPWLAGSAAAAESLLDGLLSLQKYCAPYLKRSLRDSLSGKRSRLEYGATALEACPIGGG